MIDRLGEPDVGGLFFPDGPGELDSAPGADGYRLSAGGPVIVDGVVAQGTVVGGPAIAGLV